MLIVAERINATRRRVAKALRERDADYIAREVRMQAAAGADFIDVNAGADPRTEADDLQWAVRVVQRHTELPLCIDSSGARGFEVALPLVENEVVMINSVTGEQQKMDSVLPIAAAHGARLVALTMGEMGLPQTVDDRLEVVARIVEAAAAHGIGVERIYVDPCVQPLSTSPDQAMTVVESLPRIMEQFPGIQTICGLSNVSFGLPYRSILNRVFLAYLIRAGLQAAICDPTERDMVATIAAAEALCGKDEFCMNYITAEREGRLRPGG